MLNFGIFLPLSKNMASEKKKKPPSKFNSLCTTDSQLPSAGEKQSKSLS